MLRTRPEGGLLRGRSGEWSLRTRESEFSAVRSQGEEAPAALTSRRQVPLRIAEADPRACTLDVRVRSLARAPFFAGLSERDLADIDARCGMRALDADEVVYRAGQPAARLYVVAQGVVGLTRTAADGQELLFEVLGTGGHLGALPALGEEQHVETARGLTPRAPWFS